MHASNDTLPATDGGGPSTAVRRQRARGTRYVLVSVFNTVAGQLIVALSFGWLGWAAFWSVVLATTMVSVPSFLLYRHWVWSGGADSGGGGSGIARQALPFALITIVGLVVSSWAAFAAERLSENVTDSRAWQTLVVLVATSASLLLLWIVRFLLFQAFVFRTRDCAAATS